MSAKGSDAEKSLVVIFFAESGWIRMTALAGVRVAGNRVEAVVLNEGYTGF